MEFFDLEFEDGERVRINVSDLNAELDRVGVVTMGATVTPGLKAQLLRNGLEPDYLAHLRAGPPDFRPLTQIERGGLWFVVDGNHRAWLWIEAGSPVIPVRMAPEAVWRRYAVELVG